MTDFKEFNFCLYSDYFNFRAIISDFLATSISSFQKKKIEYRESNATKQYYLQYCAAFVNEFIFYINN